ncbi:MAG: zf-TFIIB domain-containing protein [Betaproteobacteria bacterium]|jgi:Zn-finger nucleic acid-binding protein|nr:zf-TFIIB domain-containing protein [Betaproteobacteria bacterium]
MKCPVCREVTLTMAERQGVNIDYCHQCRGVWLDRGELETLIRRTGVSQPARGVRPADYRYGGQTQRSEAGQRNYGWHKSWLAGIFD